MEASSAAVISPSSSAVASRNSVDLTQDMGVEEEEEEEEPLQFLGSVKFRYVRSCKPSFSFSRFIFSPFSYCSIVGIRYYRGEAHPGTSGKRHVHSADLYADFIIFRIPQVSSLVLLENQPMSTTGTQFG